MKPLGYLIPEDKMKKITAKHFSLQGTGWKGFGNKVDRPICCNCKKIITKGECFIIFFKDGKKLFKHKKCDIK